MTTFYATLTSLWETIKRSWERQSRCTQLSGVMLMLSVCALMYQRDSWRYARATGQEIQAASFRQESAAALAPYREQLRRIAVIGIQSPEDVQLAQTAAAVLAVDLFLQEDSHE